MDNQRDPLKSLGTLLPMEKRGVLQGLLPSRVETMEEAMARELAMFRGKTSPIEKYVYLSDLQDRAEHVFFALLLQNVAEMMPIVYTPTVGEACQKWSALFRRPRGMYIPYTHRGSVGKLVANWPVSDVSVIVFTDGERILGLGDLGMNGHGIPIGKLALYTAFAGIHPRQVLPVTLDVGTNNETLRSDPSYLGLKQDRVRGEAFKAFVGEFIDAAVARFGRRLLLQFEDFGNSTAFHLLNDWRDRVCCFNDDIQGTASVALAGIMASTRLTGTKLSDHVFLFMGAGEAGAGIANLIAYAIAHEDGVSLEAARKNVWMVDSRGLVVASRSGLAHQKVDFAHEGPELKDLAEIVRHVKATALIGVCAIPHVFTPEVLAAVGQNAERPVVFALSNPTSKAECTAEEAYAGTQGKGIFASGSPFDPVVFGGKTFRPGQGNNAFIFPGVGLGAICSGAATLDDHAFYLAARALSGEVLQEDLDAGCLYPALDRIRQVSARVAEAVLDHAYESGVATVTPRPENAAALIESAMYDPRNEVARLLSVL